MTTMKAFVPTGDPAEPVVLADVPEPTPRPDEALVKVEAFSVNRGETFKLEKPAPGERPGKDIAGLVVQPAADGSGPSGIARVVGHPMSGGWAEYVAVPAGALAELPDDVSVLQGAALPLAGLTALRLLRAAGPVLGRRILLTGASGGVGHFVTELAAAAGAQVTAVTRDAERGARLAELGAAEIVHDVADARGPYDIVLESTGGHALPLALARLARRGTLIWFGQASRTAATLDFFDFFTGPESAVIRHFHYLDADTRLDDDLAALVRLTAEGRLHPEIGRVTDWADTATTLTDLRDRRIRGKAVLTLS
ncbi:NADPH:quinone reductase-like Zn-dependent oxidoreductase [Streptomyces griseochromogenes]|uniref:NADPH:quinone reductase-like Zn-dependent oxidoreductase n=2 Tax=Streptomyces griseochromogenes TaxID=68214 RepID=A0ABS4LZZ4_9ACTN|nr:NADPH:quinone reductase-like Zn-dependent oxidoreductase [Streptomyces griseochromogenes]